MDFIPYTLCVKKKSFFTLYVFHHDKGYENLEKLTQTSYSGPAALSQA